ncbi:UNVERIFIED_CONTAM: hypothetical protein HDU68_000799 [Siphonaria sp. JEL0065]|nr:hypothetical protein HDU68_000799 [Siphonaria sp. JEL0065]
MENEKQIEAATQQRELDRAILETIKTHLSSGEQLDKHAGLLIEINNPTSPLFVSETQTSHPSHVLLSYPGALFQDSAFAVLPLQEGDAAKLVEIVSFAQYETVLERVSQLLEKELLSIHRPKLVLAVGKDIHSKQLSETFGLDHINAKDLSAAVADDVTDTLSLLQKAISQSTNTRGILIDGFPATVNDATEFEKTIGPISAVLNFNSSFVTNNSVEAIKRRLYGIVDNVEAVQKPLIKYFGKRVIAVKGNGDDASQYQEAWAKLFVAGLFSRDQNIVLSIGNGSHPAEANLLSTQLAMDHNLSLVRLGSSKYQTEAIISKYLGLFNSKPTASQFIQSVNPATTNLPQISSLQKENRLLTQQSNFLKRSLVQTNETHASEINVLLSDNQTQLDRIAELEKALQELTTSHKKLLSNHANHLTSSAETLATAQSKLDALTSERDALETRKSDLELQLAQTKSSHAELITTHETLQDTHTQLLNTHEESTQESAARKTEFESQIENLKQELQTAQTDRESAIKNMEDALFETDIHAQKTSEMEAAVILLNQQLIKAGEKYKKSRDKELEDQFDKSEQVIASVTAEAQFLKSLLTSVDRSTSQLERKGSTNSSKRVWSFLGGDKKR